MAQAISTPATSPQLPDRKRVVIFIGIPATGKSTFYREHFFRTHVRINLDMLKNRRREGHLVAACLEAKQPFVVDNTNPSKDDRQRYIVPAKAAGFSVEGYFFKSSLEDALRRNAARKGKERIRDAGLLWANGCLESPSLDEGFDALFIVRLRGKGRFRVSRKSSKIIK